MTETALRERRWGEADGLAARALLVAPRDPAVRFLAAAAYSVPLRMERKSRESITILETLLSEGFQEPAVYLFLADLYEYEEKDYEKALDNLEKYRRLKDDRELEDRYQRLLQHNSQEK
jgi:predicted Zn-dependent protease